MEQAMFARGKLAQFSYSHSLADILQATLDEVETLTGSSIGFFHFLESNQNTLSLQAWSTRTLKEFCSAEGKGLHYDIDKAGVWTDCVRERRAVIHNNYKTLPNRKGMPEGHATVMRELVVPVFRADQIVAILGVGNKPKDYDESDIKFVSLLADLAWDIAEHKLAEERIHNLNRVYAVLSGINQAIIRIQEPQSLFDEACRIAVEVGKFRMAWIGLFDEHLQIVRPVAHAGMGEDYLQKLNITLSDNEHKNGPTARAFRTGTCVICSDIERDLQMATWRDDALREGYRSSAAFPINVFGEVRGTINLYAATTHFFTFQEVALLNELSMDVGYALEQAEKETQRKQTEVALQESEQRCREIFDNTSDCLYLLEITEDGNFRNIDVNPALERSTGIPRAEFIGKTQNETVPEETARQVNAKYRRCVETGKPIEEEAELDLPSGHRIYQSTLIPIRDHSGRIHRIAGISRDITERKNAERELQQSRDLLRAIIDAAPAAIIGLDLNGHVQTVWNTAAEKMLGWKAEEVMGRPLPTVPRRDQKEFKEFLEQIHSGKTLNGVEIHRQRRDGSLVDFSIYASPLHDAAGKVVGKVSVLVDITDRKQGEEALRQSEERFRLLSESSLSGIYLIQEGLFVYVNQAMAHMFGYEAEEVIGKLGPMELVHPDDRPLVAENIRRRVEGEVEAIHYEFRGLVKDGSMIFIEVHGRRIEYNGKIGVIGTLVDITERKQADEKLHRSEAQFQQLTDAIKEVFWMTDSEKQSMLYISKGYEEIWGRTCKSLYTSPLSWTEAIHPDDRDRIENSAMSKQKSGQYDEEYRILRPDGTIRWIHDKAYPVKDEAGHIFRIAGIADDISEQKHREEELRQAEAERHQLELELIQAQKLESLGALASGIAHDFNNILGIILGYSTLLEGRLKGPEEVSKCLGMIKNATDRASSLVKQLLTFTRKKELVFELVSVNNSVNEIVKLLYETLQKTIIVSTNLKAENPIIRADTTQIQQILLNLCVNARDAMPNGGSLVISTTTVEGKTIVTQFPKATAREYVLVAVTDTGVGMNEETKQKIFEPFFTTKEPGKGTGLGLALVRSIIEHHDGMISVESKLGEGTTFNLYFPINEPTIEFREPTDYQLADIPGGTETILLIEDEESLCEMIKIVLVAKGYTVLIARDGEEGVKMFLRYQKDIAVVLSDFGLPKYRGDEVFKRIKSVDANAKVIMVSGFIEASLKSGMLESGIKQFIQKPYSTEDILRTIRSVIDKH